MFLFSRDIFNVAIGKLTFISTFLETEEYATYATKNGINFTAQVWLGNILEVNNPL